MSDYKSHMEPDMKSVHTTHSAFPEIPDGVTVRTDNNTGRILSYSKPAPKLKSRAQVRTDLRKQKEIRRQNTWCCKCKMCWITALILGGFMIYYNVYLRVLLY